MIGEVSLPTVLLIIYMKLEYATSTITELYIYIFFFAMVGISRFENLLLLTGTEK